MKKTFLSLCVSLFCFWNFITLEAQEEPNQIVESVTIAHTQDRMHLRGEIIRTISEARRSILILTFTLSDPEILLLLNQKANDGVDVTVVIDKEHRLPILSLANNKIQILTRSSGEGRVHHKILVVDEQYVWIGSANFTDSAFSSQENLMICVSSSELAHFLQREAEVFRGIAKRDPHTPPVFTVREQTIRLGLLPHDGFPPKKNEEFINKYSKELLLEIIQHAKHKIQISMMVWTDLELANAIKNAYKRGVKIEVLAADFGGILPDLIKAGIQVRVNPSLSFMHNKFMYVDNAILVNGSANWSKSSFTRNDESYIVLDPLKIEQQELLDSYWNYLWPNK